MRDAISVRYPARSFPVELKLLLAGGFVVAGWLLTAVLGAPSAAADEAPSEPDTVATQQQPGLLGTVTGLVGAVTGTVDTTLSTVTGVVTETADQVTEPIVGIVDDTVETITPKAPEPVEEEPVRTPAKAGSEPIVTETAAPETAPPAPAEPAAAPVHAVSHHAPAIERAETPAPPRHQDIPDPARADNAPPAPAPTDPGDPGVVITVSHDTGNGGRDLLAVLGPRASADSVQPIVGALTSGFVGMGTEAGLPPTSPD